MSAKLYIVEGLPCSGKSTTARHIAERVGGLYFDEGCGNHPADFEFDAFIPDGTEGFTPGEMAEIRQNGERQTGGVLLPLGKVSGMLFDKAIRFKIYDRLDWETERPVMLRRWKRFADCAGDGTYVFNCVLMQNPMCETMMRFNMPAAQSLEYISEICRIIAPLEPAVVYLKSAGIAAQIRAAIPERGQEWLSAVVDYHCSGGYGSAQGLSGFDGYIAALQERQSRELDMLGKLPVRHIVFEPGKTGWESAYSSIDEFL